MQQHSIVFWKYNWQDRSIWYEVWHEGEMIVPPQQVCKNSIYFQLQRVCSLEARSVQNTSIYHGDSLV